jgi:hypothetical protein
MRSSSFTSEGHGDRRRRSQPVAAALIEKATELLVRAPEIERVDVLAAKLSATSAA